MILSTFTNAELLAKVPDVVEDHGNTVPDWEQVTRVPLGRWQVEPAGSTEDHQRALAAETQWVAYGPPTTLSEHVEIDVHFDDGRRIHGLAMTGIPASWAGPLGMSHSMLQLTHREQKHQEDAHETGDHQGQSEPERSRSTVAPPGRPRRPLRPGQSD